MLLKAIGCIFVTASSTAVGLSYVTALKKRVAGLYEIGEFLSVVKIKINYELSDIPNVFLSLKDKYSIAQSCYIHISNGSLLKIAWRRSVEEFASKMHLTQQDQSLLNDFSQCFGETDLEGQLSNFSMYSELLRQNYEQAQKAFKDKYKLSMSISLFSGLLVSILLI